jgi:hypothetical protein
MSRVERHIQALRDLLVADHEAWIAEVQEWADRAAAHGDIERQRRHLAHVEQLKAMPYPWERRAASAT